ncbi:MAG: sigma-54 dependent transcriptional regulator, acetoin dehydrogenase operon transcriptional [Gammaproteobacteria bacterium]|jgi:transcriptional regulator of acetoin/glycerol metabolism|nr:sigma-54 dependent transcriptional regulator, acetoin dehydrogenase operon transcriptional [Gammaproteobacteria bacterium]
MRVDRRNISGAGLVLPADAAPHADLVLRVAGCGMTEDSVAAALAPTVGLSWRRCLNDFNLDPAVDYQPTVVDQTRIKDLQAEHDELVQIARAEMDSLYEQISGSGYALLLADTSGVILCEKIDPTLKRMFVQAGLVVGAEWSEQREGTNGIGTCAAESRPITIHQSDHFRSRHIGLSCSAAPIHDPYGRVIAVLDASSVSAEGGRESQMHTIALVNASARLIEKCLFLRRHQGDAMLRFHHRPEFVDLLHDGAMAVSADGTVVATDMTGLRLLGAKEHKDIVGRSIADIFDATFDELLATSSSSRRAMYELRDNLHGRRYFASLAGAGQHNSHSRVTPTISSRAPVRVAGARSDAVLTLQDLAGEDPVMLRNMRNAQRVADCAVSVLIRGPTGSGKEAFAKAIHLASNRSRRPFVAVNCAAIPESLIESELFGYTAGAFTGARREGMRGRIAQASGGTLFLDEIGDMPLTLQTRLLRALEEQEVRPLGSERSVKLDLRVICASHRNLRELLARGMFREDLYYRLNGITLELPGLAARRDKENLIRKCMASEIAAGSWATIESAALERLAAYNWPGNVRELRNTIRTALAICENSVIRVSDLPTEIGQPTQYSSRAAATPEQDISLEHAEREALLRVIEKNDWVMSHVATQLGISRNTLYRKIKRHGIPLTRN